MTVSRSRMDTDIARTTGLDRSWLDRFVHPGFRVADPYDATHHDFAWRHRELARLMSNECPLPPPPTVIAAALEALDEANLYPHSGWELREALAAFAGSPIESIILGNGSTEILDAVTRALVGPGDEAVIHVPTYAFFETQVRLYGGTPVLIPHAEGHRFDPDAIVAAVTDRTKVVFLCSPNNPTGNSWTLGLLRRVLGAGVPTVVDQAYLECGSSPSFAPLIAEYPNLIVTRTMSKGFGLAGLRVGYGIADPEVIDVLLRVRIPFSVSLIAARACLAAVRDPRIVEERRAYISTERGRILAGLRRIDGIRPFDSDGNFVLIDVASSGRTSAELVARLRGEGQLLRAVSAHGLGDHYVRVTVGTTEQNDRFLQLFAEAVRQ